jgi:hypothetical protein
MTRLGVYKHYSGSRYRVLFVTINSTNGPDDGKTMVNYIALYGDGTMWTRDEKQFHEQLFVNLTTGVAQSEEPDFRFTNDVFRTVTRFTYEGP